MPEAVEGIQVLVDQNRQAVVLDVVSDRVDFAGFVFEADEARNLGLALIEAHKRLQLMKSFKKG